jgi:TetR/AcrR family transcriptional regulator, regulator of cefoperazone and chloramphenicol sensitivity
VLSPTSDPTTRERLLAVASEVFAERGFRLATVREICARAGANVAAVHYHFRDKEGLYREVLEGAMKAALERYPPDLGVRPGASAEDRLAAFVRSFLLRTLSEGTPTWLMSLVSKEMLEPTGALDHLVEHVHKPLFGRLRGIVAEIAGPDADPESVVLCCQAIVGQCIFYKHAQAVIHRMGHGVPSTPEAIERLAAHVTSFSLAGIRRRASEAREERR